MALLDSSRSILVVIDLQGKLVGMVHRPALVLEATRRLMRLADLFSVPVVLTEQYPKGIGHDDSRIGQSLKGRLPRGVEAPSGLLEPLPDPDAIRGRQV